MVIMSFGGYRFHLLPPFHSQTTLKQASQTSKLHVRQPCITADTGCFFLQTSQENIGFGVVKRVRPQPAAQFIKTGEDDFDADADAVVIGFDDDTLIAFATVGVVGIGIEGIGGTRRMDL